MCSIIFHQYMSECGAAIENILGADGRAADLHELEDTCMNNLDTHAFLEAIANAQCGDDIVGRGEVCNEAADLDITFLGEDSDSSGNGRYIRKNGDCVVTPTGVHFDGDGDYFTIDSWDYALDSTFSVSVWIVKEECTAGLYEYIYSHQNDDSTGMLAADSFQQPDHAWSTFYLGCEGQGAVTSSAEGSIMRYWVQDDAGIAQGDTIILHCHWLSLTSSLGFTYFKILLSLLSFFVQMTVPPALAMQAPMQCLTTHYTTLEILIP
jgi:hypothetical protein